MKMKRGDENNGNDGKEEEGEEAGAHWILFVGQSTLKHNQNNR